MKIKEVLNETVKTIIKEPFLILGASFIAVALSSITLGILGPVMWVGMGVIFLKIQRGEKPGFEDLFKHLNKILFLVVLNIIIFVAAAIGLVFILIPAFLIMAVWMYASFYLAYEDRDIIESLRLSAGTVVKNDLVAHVLIVLALIVINLLGACLAYVGTILTYPLACGFIVYMYDSLKQE